MNSDQKYNLKDLIETFSEHSKEFRKGCLERGQNIDFDICQALHVICKEIQNLKKESNEQ